MKSGVYVTREGELILVNVDTHLCYVEFNNSFVTVRFTSGFFLFYYGAVWLSEL